MPPPVGRAGSGVSFCDLLPPPVVPVLRVFPLGNVAADAFELLCRASTPPSTALPPPTPVRPVVVAPPAARFEPARAIVIGDSQSEGLEGGGRMPCTIEDHRGQRIDYFLRLLEREPSLVRDRDLVVLQMGGNDISGGRSAESIIEGYQRIVARVHELNPDATVVLSTIPVRGQYFDTLSDRAAARRAEARLNEVNAWLAEHAGTDFELFDVNEIAADPANPRLQRRDFRRADPHDVHFNGFGYRRIGTEMNERFFEAPGA